MTDAVQTVMEQAMRGEEKSTQAEVSRKIVSLFKVMLLPHLQTCLHLL